MNKKELYIGWDIGGAHTKYTISTDSKDTVECRIVLCELWKSLSQLENIIKTVNIKYKKDFHIINIISMSAEMCDIFSSRKKGVKAILSLFEKKVSLTIYTLGIMEYQNFRVLRIIHR